jgi:integrase
MPFEKRALNAMLSKLTKKLPNVRHFTPHDLRSTARSYLAALGISPIVAERCLNHSLGGLLAVYDQHDYLDERRNALEQLNAFITRCAAMKENNVPSPRQVVSLNKVFQPIN